MPSSDVREVFSVAFTPADSAAVVAGPNLAMRLLEENADLAAGAWCAKDGGIVFIVRVLADASPDALLADIYVAAMRDGSFDSPTRIGELSSPAEDAHPQITDMEALVAEMFEQWDQAGGQILIQQEFQAATVTVASRLTRFGARYSPAPEIEVSSQGMPSARQTRRMRVVAEWLFQRVRMTTRSMPPARSACSTHGPSPP